MNFVTKRIDFLIPLIVGIFSVFVAYNNVGDGIINYIDHNFPFFISQHIERLFFTWNDFIYLGYNHSIILTSNIGYYFFFYLFEKFGANYILINRLEHILPLFCIVYFMYLFIESLFKIPLTLLQKFSLLLISTFFFTNVMARDLFTMGLTPQIFAFSGITLSLFGLRKYLLTKNAIYLIILIFSTSFITNFNLPYSAISMLAVVIITLLFNDIVLFDRIKGVMIFIGLWLGINAYWIFPMFYSLFIAPPYNLIQAIEGKRELLGGLNLTYYRYSLDYLFQLNVNLPLIMVQNGEHGLLFKYFSFIGWGFLGYGIIIILLFQQIFIRKHDDSKNIFALNPFSLGLIFLSFIFLAKGIGNPFGDIYLFIFEKFNFFKIFRDSLKWMTIPFLAFTILVSYAFIASRSKYFKIIILSFFLIYLLPWGFDLFGRLKAYAVPQYYFSFRESYQNDTNNSDKRAIILDSKEGPTQLTFDTSSANKKNLSNNILKFISPIPVIDQFSNGSGVSFDYIKSIFSELKGYDADLSLFQKLGVTNIYHQLDLVHSGQYNYTEKYFDKNTIGKIEVFSIKKEYILPKIFASKIYDVATLQFKKISPVKYNIRLNHVNASFALNFLYTIDQNWKFYLNKSSNEDCEVYASYTITENNALQKEDIPNNMTVHECVSSPPVADLSDIKFIWESMVFDDTHHIVYNYANGWTIDPEYVKQNFSKEDYTENPDGSINLDLTLYFKPQSYFYLGLIVSGTTLLGCLGYLLYVFRVGRKAKRL